MLTLDYDDFFAMFGQGQHPQFRELLDSKISPYLSSIAYQFWHINDTAFSKAFYMNGYSGLALRLAQIIFGLAGVTKDAEELCNAPTKTEQVRIWKEKLMPVLLNPVVVALLKTPAFCWNALGVPLNQRKMLLDEGSIYEFVRDTLDPIPSTYTFKDGAYFYPLVRSRTCVCDFTCFLMHRFLTSALLATIPPPHVRLILHAPGLINLEPITPKRRTRSVCTPIRSSSKRCHVCWCLYAHYPV